MKKPTPPVPPAPPTAAPSMEEVKAQLAEAVALAEAHAEEARTVEDLKAQLAEAVALAEDRAEEVRTVEAQAAEVREALASATEELRTTPPARRASAGAMQAESRDASELGLEQEVRLVAFMMKVKQAGSDARIQVSRPFTWTERAVHGKRSQRITQQAYASIYRGGMIPRIVEGAVKSGNLGLITIL